MLALRTGVVLCRLVIPEVFLLSTGWSSECLLEWDSFTSLAIPSMLMMCIEWWTYEIGSFLIGQWRGELPGHSQA